jgi:hypothetical protein
MKIKDTKHYIGDIIGSQDTPVNPLKSKTPLLERLIGGGNTAESHIKRIANFADNATQQLIFELLQNADDANNDNEREGVFQVFFDDNYFLAINNGKPFTMDTTVKPGSLRRFLSWDIRGESNDSITGKYGKGSKLLYNLFIDETDLNNKDDEKRANAIFNKHNGPIIFSWSGLNGIEDLKAFNRKSDLVKKDYSDDDYPLLTKLINTYYPASPNEIHKNSKGDVNIFSTKEIAELSNFLKENLKPDPNFVWDRGTLIFIKLGKGQKEKLEFKYEDGIRSYLSFSKNISFVKINDTVIKKEKLITTGEIEVNNRKYEISFPFSDNVKDVSFVNFYNLLPVLKENHGFKFIINTKAFNIQENRQNIDFTNNYNKSRLDDVVTAIENYFQNKDVKFTNKVKLFKAILFSEKAEIKKEKDELKNFYQNLIGLLKRNIPCNNGFLTEEAENVKINVSGLKVNLTDVGLSEYYWLNEFLLRDIDKVKELLEIEEWNIINILENGDNEKIKKWIRDLSKDEYKEFVTSIEDFPIDSFKQIPIVKASNREIYTVDEFKSSNDKVLLTSRINELKKVLNKFEIITSHKLFSTMADKIVGEDEELQALVNIANENKTKIHRYDKWKIIEILKANFSDSLNVLSDKLEIFKNTEGKYIKLSNMVSSVDGFAPYDLFKFLKIEEAENNEVLQDLFLNKKKIWNKVINDWETVILKEYESNPNQYFPYAKDIYRTLLKIYAESNYSSSVDSATKIYLTSEGKFVNRNDIFINSSLSVLSEDDYKVLESIIEKTDISVPPYFLIKYFLKEPFKIKESSISGFITDMGNSIVVSRKELGVLQKLFYEMKEVFFDRIIIQPDNEGYLLIKNENNQIQYYCTDEKVNEFLEVKDNYFLLPTDLKTDFNEDDGLVNGESQDFVRGLINDFGPQKEFIDLVLKQGTEIVKKYIGKIEIELKSDKKYVKESFEAKIIQHCINNNLVEYIKPRISINGQELDHYEYVDEVKIGNLKFSLSELLPKYKGISEVISDVKANLKVKGLNNLFTAKPKQNEDIFNEIDSANLTLTQLSFAVAYHTSEEKEEWEYLSAGVILDKTEKLNEFFERKLDYTKYFQIEDFNPEIQILISNSELLINKEIIPHWVNEWIEQDTEKKKEKIKYVTKRLGLADGNNKIVEIREKLNRDEYVNPSLYENINKEEYLTNTIIWVREKWNIIKCKSDRHKAISTLIELCLNEFSYFDYALFFNSFDNDKINLKIRNQEKGKYYILENDYIDKIENSKEPSVKSIMLFIKYYEETISNLKLYDKVELSIEKAFAENEEKDVSEWKDKFYEKWKEDKSVDYNGIFFTVSDLPFKYLLKSEDGDIIEKLGIWSDGDVALDKENKNIYISQKLIEGNDKIKPLEKYIDRLSLSPNSKEQILLLYKYERDELKSNGTGQGSSGSDENVIKRDKDSEDGEMLSNNADILKIVNSLGLSNLKKLIDSGKSIDELLKVLSEKEIAEEKSAVSKLYGYIGEALFNSYLKKEDKDFIWSSEREQDTSYAYDFKLQDIIVDVKTNIGSLKESNGSLPFYIHKNALNYLEGNPNIKYDIVRISLTDLGLADWARGLTKSLKQGETQLSKEMKNEINETVKDFIFEHNDFYEKIVIFSIKDDKENISV